MNDPSTAARLEQQYQREQAKLREKVSLWMASESILNFLRHRSGADLPNPTAKELNAWIERVQQE